MALYYLRIKYFVLPFDAGCLNYTYNGTTMHVEQLVLDVSAMHCLNTNCPFIPVCGGGQIMDISRGYTSANRMDS